MEAGKVIKGSVPPVFILYFLLCRPKYVLMKHNRIMLITIDSNSQKSSSDNSQEVPYPTGAEVEMSARGSQYDIRFSRRQFL